MYQNGSAGNTSRPSRAPIPVLARTDRLRRSARPRRGSSACPLPRHPAQVHAAREALDAQVRDVVRWHFSPDTGTPFWLDRAKTYKFNPLKDVQGFDDLKLFGFFEDDWLRGAPGLDIRRWVPRGFTDKPVYVFETGGTTGMPKIAHRPRRSLDRLRDVLRHAAG